MSTPDMAGIGFQAQTKTVVLLCRNTIDQVVKESGVSSLTGFSNLAAALVRQSGAEHGCYVEDGKESEWCLGALTETDAKYLNSFLKASERSEILNLLSGEVV